MTETDKCYLNLILLSLREVQEILVNLLFLADPNN